MPASCQALWLSLVGVCLIAGVRTLSSTRHPFSWLGGELCCHSHILRCGAHEAHGPALVSPLLHRSDLWTCVRCGVRRRRKILKPWGPWHRADPTAGMPPMNFVYGTSNQDLG